MNGLRNITRGPLGKQEALLLTRLAGASTFSIQDARRILKHAPEDATAAFLQRLEQKGWIRRIKQGRFAVIPISSGEERLPQLHEFAVAMNLVSPAAIAYWSALNHHGLTEQLPRTVFVATNHPLRRPTREALGFSFKIVSLRPHRYFGVIEDWINEQSFSVTDREKTIIDGLDIPKYVGGVQEIAKALLAAWQELDEKKLCAYAVKIGNSAVVKRLGFLMESLKIGRPDELRKKAKLSPGFSPLDPTMPREGRYNRRWGLLVNTAVKE